MKAEDPLVQTLLKTLMELEKVDEKDLRHMIEVAGQLCTQLERPESIAALMFQVMDVSKVVDSSITGYA